MIGSILSKFLGRGRSGGSPAGGGMGGGSGTDAAVGRGAKGLLRRFTKR